MKRLLLLLTICLLSLSSLQAQSDPLMIVMNGGLYTWSGDPAQAVTPYTACSPSERIVSDIALSSNGQIALLTEPQPVTDMVAQFGALGAPLPTNIQVCDGNGVVSIASQPDNFSFFDADVADVAVVRSTPTWSPAGDALAWTSFNLATGLMHLDIYNANGDGAIVSNRIQLPESLGPAAPPFITWGESGIYMFHATLDEQTFALIEIVFVFDGSGTLMGQAELPPTDETRFVYDKFIVSDNGQEYVGLLYSDGVWELVDPMTGEAQPANGVGELYVTSGGGDISLLLSLDESQQYVWTAKNASGIIIDVNGNPVAVPGVFPTSTDLSNGGQWVFQLFDGLYYWSMTASGYINGTEAVTSGFSALAWSPTSWRIHHDG